MKPGQLVIDSRNPTVRGVLNGYSKCGRYAVVKFKGRKANLVPVSEVRKGPHKRS